MSDLNERMAELVRRIQAEQAEKTSKMKPSGSQMTPQLKKLEKWSQRNEPKPFAPAPKPKSSIETPRVQKQPEAFDTSKLTKADWDGMKMRAQLSLTQLREQVIALQTNTFLESPFFDYIQEEIEQLAEAVKDIESILKMDLDKKKMSEQGIHEYEPFLKKREQLLLKFKK